jgi:hypothetical protein
MANSKKRCKFCGEYGPAEQGIKVPAGFFCSIDHARQWAYNKNKRAAKARTRDDLDRIKSLSEICSETQRDVNAMIRAADQHLYGACIATGGPISDAGHFHHAGAQYRISWLRFHHANIHGQSAQSNRFSGGGDKLNYLSGLVARHGQTYYEELEDFKRCTDSGLYTAPTREELKGLAAWCRAMTRIYKKL